MNPLPLYRHTLTGECRPRRGRFNRVIMQVRVKVESLDAFGRPSPMPPLPGAGSEAWIRFEEEKRRRAAGPAEYPVLGTSYHWRDARMSDFILSHGAALPLRFTTS